MILQSLAGLPAFLVYFCTALVAVVAFLFVYTRVTPHDEKPSSGACSRIASSTSALEPDR
jgi:uncharacterized membrane protein YjfL (UPF0719 family)